MLRYVKSIFLAKYRIRPPPTQLQQQKQETFPKELPSPTNQIPASAKDGHLSPSPVTGVGKGPPTVPCDECGSPQPVTWKGGGYNMT